MWLCTEEGNYLNLSKFCNLCIFMNNDKVRWNIEAQGSVIFSHPEKTTCKKVLDNLILKLTQGFMLAHIKNIKDEVCPEEKE